MLFAKGEDPPSENDIEYYGLLYACQQKTGEFALYSARYGYAARGRMGTSPLYWNRRTLEFSFERKPGMRSFPPGYLYNFQEDRLVCWDNMYYDKPLRSTKNTIDQIDKLLTEIVSDLEPKIDAILFSPSEGSILATMYIEKNVHAYTAVNSTGCLQMINPSHTCVHCENVSEFARFLKENTEHRKFMCGLGYSQLLNDGKKKRTVHDSEFVKEFAKFGLEVYSPFCDFRLVDYVMDMTHPDERKKLLLQLLEDEVV